MHHHAHLHPLLPKAYPTLCVHPPDNPQAVPVHASTSTVSSDVPPPSSPTHDTCHVSHLLVTSGELQATLAKLLLFRLNPYFKLGDIYSSSAVSKYSVFRRVKAACPNAVGFVAIGDGPEEMRAAQEMGWPFIRVSAGEKRRRTYKGGVAWWHTGNK